MAILYLEANEFLRSTSVIVTVRNERGVSVAVVQEKGSGNQLDSRNYRITVS